jgi:hypothetical protein
MPRSPKTTSRSEGFLNFSLIVVSAALLLGACGGQQKAPALPPPPTRLSLDCEDDLHIKIPDPPTTPIRIGVLCEGGVVHWEDADASAIFSIDFDASEDPFPSYSGHFTSHAGGVADSVKATTPAPSIRICKYKVNVHGYPLIDPHVIVLGTKPAL